jgi:starvation-inducible DNA-binding protein
MTSINIGIAESDRRAVAGELSKLLADSYTLYLKTHNFHWNVTGPMFQTLHIMFEQQYTELATAVDLIAERIRALGVFAPATYSEFLKLSSIKEPAGIPHFKDMIHQLIDGHETVSRSARAAYAMADKANDEASADLLTQRMQLHEKTAWMLRSLVEG